MYLNLKNLFNDKLNQFSFVGEVISKTLASCFIRVSKHSKTIKALSLQSRAFISFLVFGNPNETLALVFEILLEIIGNDNVPNIRLFLPLLQTNIEDLKALLNQKGEIDL